MLTIPALLPVYLAPGPTDMRKSFIGLQTLVVQALRRNPASGHVFAFCNKRRNMVKLLFWDGNGFWIACKRLESGVFPGWPRLEAGLEEVVWSEKQLRWLLDGLDPIATRPSIPSRFDPQSWGESIPEAPPSEFEDNETMKQWRNAFGL